MIDDQKARALSAEIESYSGTAYDPKDLQDFEWCFKEIGRLGFSVSVTFLPFSYFEDAWKQHEVRPSPKQIDQAKNGLFSYQLKGGRYAERGKHDCPLLTTATECVATALFNIHRLRSMGKL